MFHCVTYSGWLGIYNYDQEFEKSRTQSMWWFYPWYSSSGENSYDSISRYEEEIPF